MRLGNSNGNNKGKKYVRKDQQDIVFATRAKHFNEWMSQNHASVVRSLRNNDIFDEDIFGDTYEKMYTRILYSDTLIEDYKSYFHRSYYTNYIRLKIENKRNEEQLRMYEKNYTDVDFMPEIKPQQPSLETIVMKHIYSNYSIRDFELFKMYMSLKPAVNYASLSKITGVKPYIIQRVICKIKKDIRSNKEFSQRWREIYCENRRTRTVPTDEKQRIMKTDEDKLTL